MPKIPVANIVPGDNPRTYFDPKEMEELTDSIRAMGLLQAPVVRPTDVPDIYKMVAGERRWRAVKALGEAFIEVVIAPMSDEQAHLVSVTENVVRANMSAAEEAEAAQRCVLRNQGDREEAARELGWRLDRLNKRLRLTACAPAVRQALAERRITVGHAELLASVPQEKQLKALARIIEGQLSVEYLREHIGKLAQRLDKAIFDTAQCAGCPHNSTTQASLFDQHIGAGYCTNATHYEALTAEKIEQIRTAQAERWPKVIVFAPEDKFDPLRLVAQGPLGVGEPQAQACRGCAEFGAAVSAVPGSQGEVLEALCFNAACNQKMVAKARAAETAATCAAQCAPSTTGNAHTSKCAPASQHAAAGAKPNTLSRGVQAYRLGQWRKIAARELHQQPAKAQGLLIAMTLGHQLSRADVTRYEYSLKTRFGFAGAAQRLHEAWRFGAGLDDAARAEAVSLIACACAYGVDEADLVRMLRFLNADVAAHWQMDAAFLDLLTKSELDALAAETGLKAKLGTNYAKLAGSNKEAFIAGLLGVEGFSYAGVVPQVMQYPREEEAAADRAEVATHHAQAGEDQDEGEGQLQNEAPAA